MITETEFKHCKALVLEDENFRVTVIPELGGKIASLKKKNSNFELLFQHKGERFVQPVLHSNFADFDASGFDDCFPSVDSCSVTVNGRTVHYPDHGEIWSKRMDYSIDNDQLILDCISEILPYSYEKKITVREGKLILEYKIVNTGTYPFPCIWTMHGLFNCEENMEIFLPTGTERVLIVQDSRLLGKAGTIHDYPAALLNDGSVYMLNRVGPSSACKTEKFYVNGVLSEGVCGLYYPSKDMHLGLEFDTDSLPFLGVWITEGGFRGDYNMALEPSNGFYDRIDTAQRNGKVYVLDPSEKLNFRITLELRDGGIR